MADAEAKPFAAACAARDTVRVSVTAEDECGNNSTAIAKINIVENVPTPTVITNQLPLPTLKPTEIPPKATESPRQGNIRPTEKVNEVEVVEEVEAIPQFFFRFPVWIWFLLVTVGIMGIGGVFWDPRPRQINRKNKIKESLGELIGDIYED